MKTLFSEIPFINGERVVLRKMTMSDADGLRELVNSSEVYRYLPAVLYEKRYEDVDMVIKNLYDECLEESLILGIFYDGEFSGLMELYDYVPSEKKVSIGVRLLKRYRGRGVASEVLELTAEYLFNEIGIEIVAASSMSENPFAANILKKHGFELTEKGVYESWGFDSPVKTDKWRRKV